MNTITNPPSPSGLLPAKSIVLVGMPGAGKSSIGRRLGTKMALPFLDSDTEVEKAANMSVEQIFERFGEAEFRSGEKRVMTRLLAKNPHVISTGGGTFIDDEIRELIQEKAISVWLRVDIETLFERVSRRNDRPLLKGGDPRAKLEHLLQVREPVYAEADIVVDSDHRPTDETVAKVLQALSDFAKRNVQAVGA